jgi:hypothetical protein
MRSHYMGGMRRTYLDFSLVFIEGIVGSGD